MPSESVESSLTAVVEAVQLDRFGVGGRPFGAVERKRARARDHRARGVQGPVAHRALGGLRVHVDGAPAGVVGLARPGPARWSRRGPRAPAAPTGSGPPRGRSRPGRRRAARGPGTRCRGTRPGRRRRGRRARGGCDSDSRPVSTTSSESASVTTAPSSGCIGRDQAGRGHVAGLRHGVRRARTAGAGRRRWAGRSGARRCRRRARASRTSAPPRCAARPRAVQDRGLLAPVLAQRGHRGGLGRQLGRHARSGCRPGRAPGTVPTPAPASVVDAVGEPHGLADVPHPVVRRSSVARSARRSGWRPAGSAAG